MKNIFLFLLFTTYITCFGQTSFPSHEMKQMVMNYGNFYGGDANESIVYSRDTIINTKKIHIFKNYVTNVVSNYLRIDSNKYWRASPYSIILNEYLIYDFNLQKGDTFNISLTSFEKSIVDTTYFTSINGQNELTSINHPYNTVKWIEEIGDVHRGLFYGNDFEGGHTELICQYDSSGLVYVNDSSIFSCDSFLTLPTSFLEIGDSSITTCKNIVYLDSIMYSGTEPITWYSSGTGAFIDPHSLSPYYIPSINDILTFVYLYACTPNQTLCDTVHIIFDSTHYTLLHEDTINPYLDFNHIVELNACDSTYNIYQWFSNGDGIFIPNDRDCRPIYVPGASDLANSTAIQISCEYNNSNTLDSCEQYRNLYVLDFSLKTSIDTIRYCSLDSVFLKAQWHLNDTTFIDTFTSYKNTDSIIVSVIHIDSTIKNIFDHFNDTLICSDSIVFDYRSYDSEFHFIWFLEGTPIHPNGYLKLDRTIMHQFCPELTLSIFRNNCLFTKSIDLCFTDSIPEIDAGIDQNICLGDSILLSTSSITPFHSSLDIKWITNNNISNDSILHPTIYPTGTTNYILTVTDTNGCIATDSVHFLISDSLFTVNAGMDESICLGDSVRLSPTITSSHSFFGIKWTPNNNISNDSILHTTIYSTGTTNYILTVTDTNECFRSDSIRIFVNDSIPVPSFIENYSINGDSVFFTNNSMYATYFKWIINDSIIVNDSSFALALIDSVTKVCLVVSNNCFSDTICSTVFAPIMDGIYSIQKESITIYPNPFTHEFKIKESSHSSFSIYTLLGKKIDSIPFKRENGYFIIDGSNLPHGMYTIQLMNYNGHTSSTRIIKK